MKPSISTMKIRYAHRYIGIAGATALLFGVLIVAAIWMMPGLTPPCGRIYAAAPAEFELLQCKLSESTLGWAAEVLLAFGVFACALWALASAIGRLTVFWKTARGD
jgi:hypothetical protein